MRIDWGGHLTAAPYFFRPDDYWDERLWRNIGALEMAEQEAWRFKRMLHDLDLTRQHPGGRPKVPWRLERREPR